MIIYHASVKQVPLFQPLLRVHFSPMYDEFAVFVKRHLYFI